MDGLSFSRAHEERGKDSSFAQSASEEKPSGLSRTKRKPTGLGHPGAVGRLDRTI
jgi:hypothetical protein